LRLTFSPASDSSVKAGAFVPSLSIFRHSDPSLEVASFGELRQHGVVRRLAAAEHPARALLVAEGGLRDHAKELLLGQERRAGATDDRPALSQEAKRLGVELQVRVRALRNLLPALDEGRRIGDHEIEGTVLKGTQIAERVPSNRLEASVLSLAVELGQLKRA